MRGDTLPNLDSFYLLTQEFGVSMKGLCEGTIEKELKPIQHRDKPIISLLRQPRDTEMRGLEIVRFSLQGMNRGEIMNHSKIPFKETYWELSKQIALSDMLHIETKNIPSENELTLKITKEFELETCLVADLDSPNFLVNTMVLGSLGAKEIQKQARNSRYPLRVGFVGGDATARVVISLIQDGNFPKLDIMPIAVQSPEEVIAYDANSLVGMLGFFSMGTEVHARGLPFTSNSDLKQFHDFKPFDITRQMLDLARKVDMAFLGLGSSLNYFFHENAKRSPIKNELNGYTFRELENKGFIGDILYTPVTSQGPMPELQSWCEQMVCSIGLDGLQELVKRKVQVIAIASGPSKAAITRLALERKYINGLIIDKSLAQSIINKKN